MVKQSVSRVCLQSVTLCRRKAELDKSLLAQFDDDDNSSDEVLLLQTRYWACQEKVNRPFAYVVLTHPQDAPPLDDKIINIAWGCFTCCFRIIALISRHSRHEETWNLLRRAFSCALLLQAAGDHPRLKTMMSKTNCDRAIQEVVDTLRRWEREGSDIQWMRDILESVVRARSLPRSLGDPRDAESEEQPDSDVPWDSRNRIAEGTEFGCRMSIDGS